LQAAVREVPLERLLVETDSPYLSPEPRRGRRNEPAQVVFTLSKMAELRGLPVDEMAEITWNNACELYRIPKD
jgi:TatD DNase family protein